MAIRKSNTLVDLGLKPALGESLPSLFAWLEQHRLTYAGRTLDLAPANIVPGAGLRNQGVMLAQATHRYLSEPLRPQQLKEVEERFKDCGMQGISWDALWAAQDQPRRSVRALHWSRVPADAMAFYRPFHVPPFDQWGVYLLIGPLLAYHRRLLHSNASLRLFSPETLMHLVLFEVFHHEFFHHLVESTATTLEILQAAQGQPKPVYLDFVVSQHANPYQHPHAPLEEALANAYAYNALSFIARVKAGFKTASVKAYQQAVSDHWNTEPEGYREAGHYAGAAYVDGGAELLAQMLQTPQALHRTPLAIVAKHVMPNGFTALVAKPDIPTWLVGSPQELEALHGLVPAANEAYTQLFWPYNTTAIDRFIAEKIAQKKAQKREIKEKGAPPQHVPDLFA